MSPGGHLWYNGRMRLPLRFALLLLAVGTACRASASIKVRSETSLSNVIAFARANATNRLWFTVRGTVMAIQGPDAHIVLRDETARASLGNPNRLVCAPGDRVVITGITTPGSRPDESTLSARKLRILGSGPPPTPRELRLADVAETATADPVTTRGFVVSAKADEVDPRWVYLVLQDGRAAVYVTVPANPEFRESFRSLVEAKVEITGFIAGNASGRRRFFGRHISLPSAADLKVLTPAPRDVFAAPPLEDIDALDPADVRTLLRRRVTGTVLAAWGGDSFLLKDDRRRVLRVELVEPGDLPKAGTRTEAVGFPETDLYHLNLTRALFRPAPGPADPPDMPKRVRPEDILLDASGNRRIETRYHGQTVSLRGIVRTQPAPDDPVQRFELDCGRFQVPVDVSADPSVLETAPIGSRVEADGICLLESSNWQSAFTLPAITGIAVVLRSSADLRVLERPSWWTSARLLSVIAALAALLLGALVWNRFLNRLIVRRSRQLLHEELKRKSAEWRVGERTRLAVELHDSLSQNLSGLACQITAVRKSLPDPAGLAGQRLDIAERMLTSSRTELKRCLWDLRGDALGCPSMTEAVIRTVRPVVGEAELAVRFGLSTARLPDTVAHAILCIVRELASNAVRHGRATRVQIAGAHDRDRILFSVRDDGCGFDVERHAGVAEGHFGLEGLRERIDRLGGAMEITSAKETGTLVRIDIPRPRAAGPEEDR